ncbi:hypothetical protein FA95DRAFT_482320 [Auriscalpium vulgare]|uniref:Uncharacterized protein n=1 Tax=Auriscalpium vulgare TaxID=40419 RepID=A0ACB8SB59_9AGAM|nr:hypothetical protein FA95DRAFT_482320 [Auriscalpium vulgare]
MLGLPPATPLTDHSESESSEAFVVAFLRDINLVQSPQLEDIVNLLYPECVGESETPYATAPDTPQIVRAHAEASPGPSPASSDTITTYAEPSDIFLPKTYTDNQPESTAHHAGIDKLLAMRYFMEDGEGSGGLVCTMCSFRYTHDAAEKPAVFMCPTFEQLKRHCQTTHPTITLPDH